MVELLNTLRMNKELRQTLKVLINLMDNLDTMEAELNAYDDNVDDVRRIAEKLERENSRLLQEKHSLEMDKKALTQFILDEVDNAEVLKKIFF